MRYLQYLAIGVQQQPLVFQVVLSTPTHLLGLHYLACKTSNHCHYFVICINVH